MPDRVLRSGLLWSVKINSVSEAAELLYVRLLLIADDFGLLDIDPMNLKIRALPGRDQFDLERIAKCTAELIEIELLSAYAVNGKKYAAVENWNQRRWAKASKLPMPPWGKEHIAGGYVAPTASAAQSAKKPSDKGNGEPPAGFSAFWELYPRKEAKADAIHAWIEQNPDADLQARILAAVAAQKSNGQWSKENGQFIPYPAKWLNARRWEDEVKPDHDPDRLVI
jgi:hypothetical protein